MKAWSTIYNLFGLLILLFMIMIMNRDIRTNERQFQELKLKYAVDYATEAAFLSSLEGGNLGISYEDLQNIKVNPENVLHVFKTVMALSYDMSLSKENLESLDTYISSAVLAVSDGYYISSLREVDTDKLTTRGGEYALRWGLKKPYIVQYGTNRYVSYNISNESWVMAKQTSTGLSLKSGEKYMELTNQEGITTVKKNVLKTINQTIMDDINDNVKRRNELYGATGSKDFVYLPSIQTASGINTISKPSLFMTLSGVDFAGTQKLEAKSVGGYTVAKKRRVLAFREGGKKYYCYETQLADLSMVDKFYNTVDEASLAGYRPHLDYIRKPLKD